MPEYNAENTDFPIGATLVNIAKDTLSSSPHRLMSEESTIRYNLVENPDKVRNNKREENAS